MHLTKRRTAVVAAAVLAGLGVAVVPAAPALASPGCGTVITTNTTVTSDLTCPGDAYIVGADGITINLAGHTISGSGTGIGITVGSGAPPGFANVTVTNGTVKGFATDIGIESGHDLTFKKLQLSAAGTGIFSADNTTIALSNSTVRNAPLHFQNSKLVTLDKDVLIHAPVSFANSSNTPHITGSTLTDSSVGVQASDDALLAHDVFVRSPVSVHVISRRPAVRNSTFTGADIAVEFDDAVLASKVTNNTFTGNRIGLLIRTFGSIATIVGTVVSGNTFTANGAAGLMLDSDPNTFNTGTVTITSNTATANGYAPGGQVDLAGHPVAAGLHILAAKGDDIRVGKNTTSSNASYGIFAVPGTVVDLGGNTSTANPNGCLGVAC